ncbi:MAG: hydroxyphenylacetyl-CoA thioesterase PaaI [Gammaproteobacteria bacterium]
MSPVTPGDPLELARAAAEQMFDRDRASQHLGITLDEVSPGYARMSMLVQEWMLQGHDMCHGGLMFALADTAMAFASNSRNQPHVALNANIDYLRPARLGETLTAEAREGHRSGRTGMYDVRIVDASGAPVCHFRGRTYGLAGTVLRDSGGAA